MSTTYQPNNGK